MIRSFSRTKSTATVALLLGLFLFQLILNMILVKCVNHHGILTWEETLVDFCDVFLLPLRLQHSVMQPNWGEYVYYWLGSHLLTPISIFYARYWKATGFALISPMIYWVSLRYLRISRIIALFSAALSVILPGFFIFSWLALESGLDCIFGLSAILFALRAKRGSEFAAVVCAAYSALCYAPGLCFGPVIALILARNISRRGDKFWPWTAAYTFLYAAVIAIPLFWWTNHPRILRGGGGPSTPPEMLEHLFKYFHELLYRCNSYYCFTSYAALSSALVGLFVACGIYLAIRLVRENRESEWAWVLIGFSGASLLYIISGREPGMRRGLPIMLFSMFFFALASDQMLTWARSHKMRLRATLALLVFIFVYAGTQYTKTATRYWTGQFSLPTDFDFTYVLPSASMETTFEWLAAHPDVAFDRTRFGPENVLTALYIIGERNGHSFTDRDAVLKSFSVKR